LKENQPLETGPLKISPSQNISTISTDKSVLQLTKEYYAALKKQNAHLTTSSIETNSRIRSISKEIMDRKKFFEGVNRNNSPSSPSTVVASPSSSPEKSTSPQRKDINI